MLIYLYYYCIHTIDVTSVLSLESSILKVATVTKSAQPKRSLCRKSRRPPGKKSCIEAVLNNKNERKINVSRRPHIDVLYAFPHFDKCDSLLYFPSSITRHLNSGDFSALAKLCYSHMDKDCKVYMDYANLGYITVNDLIRVNKVMLEIQPDRIMCVHSTKVIENQIIASVYLKGTDNKTIIESVARTVTDPVCARIFKAGRTDRVKKNISEVNCSEEEKMQIAKLVDSGQDMLVYVHLSMVFTFNDVTKKVTSFDCRGKLTSVHAAQNI